MGVLALRSGCAALAPWAPPGNVWTGSAVRALVRVGAGFTVVAVGALFVKGASRIKREVRTLVRDRDGCVVAAGGGRDLATVASLRARCRCSRKHGQRSACEERREAGLPP